MAYIPRSSFIPKETSGAIPMQAKRRQTVQVFSLISTTLVILALLGVAGILIYKSFLNKQLNTAQVNLNAVSSNSDSKKKIEEIQQYDTRLTIAHNILDNHIAPSRIFSFLEDSTKETVQFQMLEYVYDPGFEASLTLGGNTKELASVALQKMEFIKDSVFSDFAFKNISSATVDPKDSKNQKVVETVSSAVSAVKFTVKGVFKPEIVKYTGNTDSETSAPHETINPSSIAVPDVPPTLPTSTPKGVTP